MSTCVSAHTGVLCVYLSVSTYSAVLCVYLSVSAHSSNSPRIEEDLGFLDP